MTPRRLLSQDLLPYGVMLDDKGVLLLRRPGYFGPLSRFAWGCLWEVTPLDIDLMPESEIERAADDVKALMLSLRVGSTLDVRLDIRPIAGVPEWEAAHQGRTDLDTELMRAHIASGMPHTPGTGRMGLRECRVTVAYRYPLRGQSRPLRQALDALAQLDRAHE